ncbi:MAG: T9SS type A sorting domain-containing protein [Candidatus Latescibacteria bacterium]|nr:T9SS type A sorting domain-containing protein [Candidatus Latescibacterota bacterium]
MTKIVLSVLLTIVLSSGQIGRTETVGYTTYDWQFCGPVYSWCRVDPVRENIHVYWLYQETSTPRNQRYNFYNNSIGMWNWADTGINVYTTPSGFGGFDYHPITGVGVAGTHQTYAGYIRAVIAMDSAPGAGNFRYTYGPALYIHPPIAVTNDGAIHCALIDYSSQDSLFYARVQPWDTWSTPINIPPPAPQPFHHNLNIISSKTSNKVVVFWHAADDPNPQRAFYRLSNNGGINWQPSTQLPFPPAPPGFNPSYGLSSLFAMFDHQDNLHFIVAVADSGFIVPAAIWHWYPANNPEWSQVYFYNPETIAAYCAYNSFFSCRPSIVQHPNNNYLYVAWEQFDSLNYEPSSNRARADIWIAESPDNGLTWHNQRQITFPNTTDKRYPCLGGIIADSLVVAYMIDSVAGSGIQGQGRLTRNPIAVQRIPIPLTGSAENPILQVSGFTLSISPNLFSSHTTIRFTLPASNQASLQIYDVTGRLIKSFTDNQQLTTNNYLVWDGKDNNGMRVKPGIYFVSLKTSNQSVTTRIIKIN